MKAPKISTGQAQVLIGVLGLAVAMYALYQTKDTIKSAANAVNPLNNENVINKGANAIFGMDNKTESIGTKIYDLLHPEPKKMETVLASPVPKKPVGIFKADIDPTLTEKKKQIDDFFWNLTK
jgi:hypothetical protein